MGCGSSTATGRETSATTSRSVPPTPESFFPQKGSAPPQTDISTGKSPGAKTEEASPSAVNNNRAVTTSDLVLPKKKEAYIPPPAIGYEQPTNAAAAQQQQAPAATSSGGGSTPRSAETPSAVVSAEPPSSSTTAPSSSQAWPPSSPSKPKKPYVPPAPIHLAQSSSPLSANNSHAALSTSTPIHTNTTKNKAGKVTTPHEELDDEAESLEGSFTSDALLHPGDDAEVLGSVGDLLLRGGSGQDLVLEASKGVFDDNDSQSNVTESKSLLTGSMSPSGAPTQLLHEKPQPSSESGMRFDELYRLKGVLGTGAFSTVREGFHRSNSEVSFAVKCVNRKKLSEEDEAALLDEVGILKEMNHIHIIRLYDFFVEPSTYYLVLERMRGGELFDRIVAKAYYNEKEARDTCKILLEAVRYCHAHNVAHRDLKPENLLLLSENDDSAVKIADFGFAKKVYEKNSLTTQCGTPGYVAPEILEGTPYDERADMWSVGVILYILLGGYPPFIESTQRDLFRKIRKGEYEFHEEYWGTVSAEAKDLISSLLTVDANQRLTAEGALQNPWITFDDAKLVKKDLGVNLQKFRNFNAKRKFRAAVSTIIAINKLNSLKEEFFTTLKDTTVQLVAEKTLSQRPLHEDS